LEVRINFKLCHIGKFTSVKSYDTMAEITFYPFKYCIGILIYPYRKLLQMNMQIKFLQKSISWANSINVVYILNSP